jgi:hypothetical protein
MILKDTGGGDFENPEPGTYAAICYKIIDIGTQEGEYQGQKNNRRQLIIGWELNENMSDGRPFVMSKFYTASLSEKSNTRKDLAGWRGRDFTPEELLGFDIKNIMGKPCMLSLIATDKGKIKVGSVSKMPKGMAAPEMHNKPIFFSLDEFDHAVFDAFSDGVKKLIIQSPEYKAAINRSAGTLSDIPSDNIEDDIAF